VESGAASPEEDAEAEFRFYELLRQLEVRIPETERKQDRADAAPSAYQIQAGSFRTFDEADSRQARLALLGIESRVVRAIVDNNIWHRVIIGPLSDREEIARVLRRLREERIDAMPPQAVSD
jgi:cell division protein FtsN